MHRLDFDSGGALDRQCLKFDQCHFSLQGDRFRIDQPYPFILRNGNNSCKFGRRVTMLQGTSPLANGRDKLPPKRVASAP